MKQTKQGQGWRRTAVVILLPLSLFITLILVFTHQSIVSAESQQSHSYRETHLPARPASQTITLTASQDNTLIEDVMGSLSNGAGDHFFVGSNAEGKIRRGLVAFNLASIPGGSTILSATLVLSMSKTSGGDHLITLHPVLADWGEGSSDASGEEGGGAPAAPGDATWLHTFYDGSLWATPGGDFAATASATTLVGGLGSYEWSSPQLVADLQGWLDISGSNFGWLLRGNETTTMTSKRFDSRNNPTDANRPMLIIAYESPKLDLHTYLPYVSNLAASP